MRSFVRGTSVSFSKTRRLSTMPREEEKRTKTITLDEFKRMTKVHFNLKSGFQIIALFNLLEVGYLVTIVVNFA